MILKKVNLIIILILLNSCGYESLYSKNNNIEIAIKKIELVGNKNISRKIIINTNLKENQNSNYNLILDSKKLIEVIAKDKNGNASIYKTTIVVNFLLEDDATKIKSKKFCSSFSYNNLANKFDLSQYQKNIEINLINNITEEILIYLNS